MSRCQWLAATSAATLLVGSTGALAAKPVTLAQVFKPEMINADVAYFEHLTGPARSTYGEEKLYKVSGCEVTAKVASGSIRSLRLNLSPKCTVNLNTFLPNFSGKFPSSHTLTFGKFDSITGGTGRFYADCLTQCGNSVDPTIYQHWYGSRADGVLEVMLEAVQVSVPVLKAASTWRTAMEKAEGEDWVVDARFNCTSKFDAIAHHAFREVRISAVTIGYNVQAPHCER